MITNWRGRRPTLKVSTIASTRMLGAVDVQSSGPPVSFPLILVTGAPGEETVALFANVWAEADLIEAFTRLGVEPEEIGNHRARTLRRRYRVIRPWWLVHPVVYGSLLGGAFIAYFGPYGDRL